ncbi:hypothetical protein CHGG_07307 [Chaetomium globosum CBS 148.51]|uniref:Uncharacterized protein n=1 Tax=Chaetomium globosum (strain ATCC 6205 / CBS 148.51 / DSM 1962 / NBRC 6347 / NRRL 1970) TaxID=306901 RepID=Q2GXJ7_CHAGB|nr:uncharacterized protein CHGG_07307 [Chaetomium globosum CBS 148.51]EAQ86054.1 hypothetical protein CHGG_07307 [Chaetomium globosum CBS 148.51]
MPAVMAVVEDEKGDILQLLLYNQADDGEPFVREGTVMILKEPFLKTMSDGSHGLRVDHLSDVVFLPANDKRIPVAWRQKPNHNGTALAWKAQGSNHFNKSEYRSAIECYTQSLTCPSTPEEMCTTRFNRSLAFLKVGRYDAALLDAEFVSTTTVAASKLTEKARLRKAETLYGLERYRECYEVLKEFQLDYPNNAAAEVQRTRAIARLAEQRHGKYHFKRLHAEAAERRPPYLDHATYIGPVRVQNAGSRGRGLFTTKAVKAGDLLFCEKAFTYAFDEENAGTGDTKLLMGHDGRAIIGLQVDLIHMTIQKLHRNPSFIPAITNLHHGSYQAAATTQIDDQPIVDTYAGSLDAVESGVEALEGTYVRPAAEVPRLEVWEILWEVVVAVWARRRTVAAEQAVRLMLAALRALGYDIVGGERGTVVVREWGVATSGAVECWLLLRDAYRETAPELVAPAEEYARTAYRIVVGEDETFAPFGEERGVSGRSTTTTTLVTTTVDAHTFAPKASGYIALEKVYSRTAILGGHGAEPPPPTPQSQSKCPSAKKQGKWTVEENHRILILRGSGMTWDNISSFLPGRSSISWQAPTRGEAYQPQPLPSMAQRPKCEWSKSRAQNRWCLSPRAHQLKPPRAMRRIRRGFSLFITNRRKPQEGVS